MKLPTAYDPPRYAVCLRNDGSRMDLRPRTLYELLPTTDEEREHGHLRVVDESGEDYLYLASDFHPVDLPRNVCEVLRTIFEQEVRDDL
jgi:hypothetical protein